MNATFSKRRDGPAGMPKRKLKVCHVTSARTDAHRHVYSINSVFRPERGHEVVYLVADGQEDETRQNVRIVGSKKPKGRWHRFFVTPRKLLALAKRIDADVYQLHDPELLTIAASLRAKGRVVVFDFHEDLPVQVLQKEYLKFGTSRILSVLLKAYQLWVSRRHQRCSLRHPFHKQQIRCERHSVDPGDEFPEARGVQHQPELGLSCE